MNYKEFCKHKDIKPFNRCYGIDLIDSSGENRQGYISPEEKKHIEDVKEIFDGLLVKSCIWPKCSCPLREIAGAYHQEKIDWIVRETIKDPKFKHKIRI